MSLASRLSVRNISLNFGGLKVADNVGIELAAGARTALIGPNGAGKTTLVNLISGALMPVSGGVLLDGQPVTHLPQAARVKAGIARSFQINRLFSDMTVADNLRVAILQQIGKSMSMSANRSLDDLVDRDTAGLLSQLGLGAHAARVVRKLAYGEQRLLEIALALALKPSVLLLDEPAAGVPKGESGVVLDVIGNLPADLAVLLIEHDMDLVFRFARRIIVMAAGAVVRDGSAAQIAGDDLVKQLYFGRKSA